MKYNTLIAFAVGSILGAAMPSAYADGDPAAQTQDNQQPAANGQAGTLQSGPGQTVQPGAADRDDARGQSDRQGQSANEQGDNARDKVRDRADITSDRRDLRKDQ